MSVVLIDAKAHQRPLSVATLTVDLIYSFMLLYPEKEAAFFFGSFI